MTHTSSPEARDGLCPHPLPPAWRAALDAGRRPHHPAEQRSTLLVHTDGALFVETFVPGQVHELRWVPAGGEPVVVQRFAPDDAASQELAASFDGRFLTYSLLHSDRTFDDWSLHVWDSRSGTPAKEIARNGRDRSGPLPGPLNAPLMHRGRVVWVQATGTGDRETALHAYDVHTGRRQVLRTGHPGAPYRLGETLLWPESDAPGALARLHAVRYADGGPARLPAAIAGLTGAAFVGTSDTAIAWTDRTGRELWRWDAASGAARRLLTVPSGRFVQRIHLGNHVVAWDDGTAQWVYDLRSGGYGRLTAEAGNQETGGPFLVVMAASRKIPGAGYRTGGESVIDTGELPPLPAC